MTPIVLLVSISVPASVANVPVTGNIMAVVAVDVRVVENAPAVISDPPSTIVNVLPVAGVVIVTLFIEVAVATPNEGVVNAGDVAKTMSPVPVLVVSAVDKFAEEGVAKNAATPLPKPLTPVDIGRPVAFVNVPEVGVPRIGVIRVGELPNDVREEAVTPEANVAPVRVPAAAVTVIFALPSNDVPLIVRGVCNIVALPALPVIVV